MRNSGNPPKKNSDNSRYDRKNKTKKPFALKHSRKPFTKKYTKESGDSGLSEKKSKDDYRPLDKKLSSKKPYKSRDGKDFGKEKTFETRPYRKDAGRGSYKKKEYKPYDNDHKKSSDRPIERYKDKRNKEDRLSRFDKPYRSPDEYGSEKEKTYGHRPYKKDTGRDHYKKKEYKQFDKDRKKDSDRPIERYVDKLKRKEGNSYSDKPYKPHENSNNRKEFSKDKRPRISKDKTYVGRKREFRETEILVQDNTYAKRKSFNNSSDGKGTRLNKFIANAGICSRREADTLIETGVISINGKNVTQLGTKVMTGDVVRFNDEILTGEQLQYLLLNKPKGYITTTDDPQERQTVMEIIKNACKERIYPVGRLDKNTSGLLLFTNDGELAKKLTHPKHQVEKVYKAELDKPLLKDDMMKIIEGIELDDGVIKIDAIAYGETKKEIGLELHSGKNRIVRRIFESLGYDVVKLDRVVFAGLTKKDLPRGKYRFLSNEEVNILRRIK